jgi:hypothetical protein
MIFTNLHAAANTWNTVGKAKEKGLFDFDFIKWMAWTWPYSKFFYFYSSLHYSYVFLGKKGSWWQPKKRNFNS